MSRLDALLARAPRVRWLHVQSAGVDGLLTPAIRERKNLTLTNSGSAFVVAIPEYVIAWMLASAKQAPAYLKYQAAHEWKFVPQLDFYGSTVGVIGLGPIGQGVASRAKALGTRTLGYRRNPEPMDGFDEILTGPDGLNRLMAESDFIAVCAPLTVETTGLIGRDQIARMKPNAWIVNIARGAIIDQPALTEALQAARIRGATLDVTTPEPLPPDDPLWDLPNVVITPHASFGGGEDLRRRQKQVFLENLRRFVNGEPLENVVDVELGY
jgi:phosphoglycerate dehydrogenase-like enzyme